MIDKLFENIVIKDGGSSGLILEVLRSWSKTQTLQPLNEDGEHDKHDENHDY